MKYAKAYEIFASQMFWRILFHLRRNRRFHPSLLGFHIAKQYFILITSMHLNTFLHPLVHLVRFALAEHDGHKIGGICEANARGLPLDPHRLHQKTKSKDLVFFICVRRTQHHFAILIANFIASLLELHYRTQNEVALR